MKFTNPIARRRPRRAKSLQYSRLRLAALLQSLGERISANRRLREKRRIHAMRVHSTSPFERFLVGLRQTLQFRGLQLRLQKRRQRRQLQELNADSQPNRTPIVWFWPRAAESLSSGDAAVLLLRSSSTALVLISLISLLLTAVPLQLTSPNWYMDVLGNIGDTVPVLVLAAVLSLLSLALSADLNSTRAYHAKLLRLSNIGYTLGLLLLPLQLFFMSWLIGNTYSNTRIQLTTIKATSNALIDGAQPITSSEQFVAYLRSRNLNFNLESISKAPLLQVKSEFIRSVKVQQRQELEKVQSNSLAVNFRYAINGLRLFLTLVIFAWFLRGYWSLLKRSSYPALNPGGPSAHATDGADPTLISQ